MNHDAASVLRCAVSCCLRATATTARCTADIYELTNEMACSSCSIPSLAGMLRTLVAFSLMICTRYERELALVALSRGCDISLR